jgi:putative transposase
MPGRKVPIVTGNTYHIINHALSGQKIFPNKQDLNRALQSIFYYQHSQPPIKFSKFLTLSAPKKHDILEKIKKDQSPIEIISFSLMSNHFHFAIKQLGDDGIAHFIANFSNSLTRHLNTKTKRRGPILKGRFDNFLVKNDEQLIHLTRYHHLQAYSAGIIKTLEEIETYPYSSFPEYLGKSQNNICNTSLVMSFFKNEDDYRKFVLSRAEYQRELEITKHLFPNS